MNYEDIPAVGTEVDVDGQKGTVSGGVATSSGVELTVRVNDDNTAAPVSVPNPVHTEAWTNVYAAGVPASERLAPAEEIVETEMPTQEEKDAEREEADKAGAEEDKAVADKRDAAVKEANSGDEKSDAKVNSHLYDDAARKEVKANPNTAGKANQKN
jgi:hypothetical protein